MLLWILFALMTAGVLAVLLRPLLRGGSSRATDAAADIAVYKDQLSEVDADVSRGLVSTADAETARREIARRLLARAEVANDGAGRRIAVRPLLGAIGGLVPVLAIGGYLLLGSPHLPDKPRTQIGTETLATAPAADLVAKVEARLAERPDDGKGWDVVAPIYFRMERFADAANAYGRAASLLGETPQRLAGFAEATVMANNGIVTEPARAAYEKIAKADPSRVEPRFWLALAKEQDGRLAEAAADYRAILAAAPTDATWRPLIDERLAVVEKRPPVTGQPPKGPSAADVKAAESLSATDRAQMIRGMVENLSKRLETNPNDAEGWQRLVQSYVVLGERDKATAALADARRKLAGNAIALSELSALAKTLGLGS